MVLLVGVLAPDLASALIVVWGAPVGQVPPPAHLVSGRVLKVAEVANG